MTMTHGPVVIRRRLGAALKKLRGQQGLHLDVVARQLEISPSKLSRLETGQVEPKIRDVRDLLDIYHAGADQREQIMRWATVSKEPGWWQPLAPDLTPSDLDLLISLETEARSVKIFCTPVAGLLQTEDYARSALSGTLPAATPAEIDKLVQVRIGRQAVLSPSRVDAPALELHAVIDESALHRRPGTSTVLAHQLRTLDRRSRLPNITIQILPFAAGYTRGSSTFAIFEPRLPTDWPVVNVESTGFEAQFDTPDDISRYEAAWDDVSTHALDEEESRRLILQAAEGLD